MGSQSDFAKLAQSAGFGDQHDAMMVPNAAISKASQDPKEVNAMLHALASGDTAGFVRQAETLGLSQQQAHHAVRDTAALAALVIQFADWACW